MIIRAVKNSDKEQLSLLLKQLTSVKINLDIQSLIDNEMCDCLVLEDSDKIIGTATISFFVSPVKGLSGIVEDVVIDQNYRGQNLGKFLMEALIKQAKNRKAKLVVLTSKPDKKNARNLYQSLGFELYDTGFFKLKLT